MKWLLVFVCLLGVAAAQDAPPQPQPDAQALLTQNHQLLTQLHQQQSLQNAIMLQQQYQQQQLHDDNLRQQKKLLRCSQSGGLFKIINCL